MVKVSGKGWVSMKAKENMIIMLAQALYVGLFYAILQIQ